MKRLTSEMLCDYNGNPIPAASDWKPYDCSGGDLTNQVVFVGRGRLSHITIGKDVDGAVFNLTSTDGTAHFHAYECDNLGTYVFNCQIPRLSAITKDGLKISTTGFTGGALTVFFDP